MIYLTIERDVVVAYYDHDDGWAKSFTTIRRIEDLDNLRRWLGYATVQRSSLLEHPERYTRDRETVALAREISKLLDRQ